MRYPLQHYDKLIVDEAQMIDFDAIVHLINKPVRIVLYGDEK